MLCFDYRDVNPEYKSLFFALGSPRGKQRGKEENMMSSREMQKWNLAERNIYDHFLLD